VVHELRKFFKLFCNYWFWFFIGLYCLFSDRNIHIEWFNSTKPIINLSKGQIGTIIFDNLIRWFGCLSMQLTQHPTKYLMSSCILAWNIRFCNMISLVALIPLRFIYPLFASSKICSISSLKGIVNQFFSEVFCTWSVDFERWYNEEAIL